MKARTLYSSMTGKMLRHSATNQITLPLAAGTNATTGAASATAGPMSVMSATVTMHLNFIAALAQDAALRKVSTPAELSVDDAMPLVNGTKLLRKATDAYPAEYKTYMANLVKKHKEAKAAAKAAAAAAKASAAGNATLATRRMMQGTSKDAMKPMKNTDPRCECDP